MLEHSKEQNSKISKVEGLKDVCEVWGGGGEVGDAKTSC